MNLQTLIIDLRSILLSMWWSLWLASPSPTNIIPNIRPWNSWNLKSSHLSMVFPWFFHGFPPTLPGNPTSEPTPIPWLRRTGGAPCCIGLPLFIIHSSLGFSMKETNQLWGYPYGNHHISSLSLFFLSFDPHSCSNMMELPSKTASKDSQHGWNHHFESLKFR